MICFRPDSARQLVDALRGNVQHFLSLRHDLGAWSQRRGANDRGRAAPAASANTGSRRRRSRRCCSTRRGGTVFRQPSSIPDTSSGRAGRRSTRPAISIRGSSPRSPGASHSLSPISGWRPSITSMPTTSRRCSCGRSPAGAARSARLFTPSRRRPSVCAAMPRRWPPGSAASPTSPSCRGRNGRPGRRKKKRRRPGSTSPAARAAASPRRERLLGYQPRYTSFEAVYEAVGWLIEQRIVET